MAIIPGLCEGGTLAERSGNIVMLVMSTQLLKIRNYPLLLNLSFFFPPLITSKLPSFIDFNSCVTLLSILKSH